MNISGLKSLDKIGDSPKVHSVEKSENDILVFLEPGWSSTTGDHILRADNIKDIWTAFRHDIKRCDCPVCDVVEPRAGSWSGPPSGQPIAGDIKIPVTGVTVAFIPTADSKVVVDLETTGPLTCKPKGKPPNDYGHVWDGGGSETSYKELKEGDPCMCGMKRWTLPANTNDRRCTPMDHCFPSPPGGTVPKGTVCYCGKRKWGVESKKTKRTLQDEDGHQFTA